MHPHPASVHFPIAYTFLGSGISILHATTSFDVSQWLPSDIDPPQLARFLQIAGLITSVPAIATGILDAVKVARKQGLYESDTDRLKSKIWASAVHAAMASVGIALAAVVVWNFSPTEKMSSLSTGLATVGLLFLMYGANLGGALAFEYGMGFSSKRKRK